MFVESYCHKISPVCMSYCFILFCLKYSKLYFDAIILLHLVNLAIVYIIEYAYLDLF